MPEPPYRGAGVAFTIRTARDMVGKLKREAERMDQAPRDVDAAINFFLTAEHIPWWLDPPNPDMRDDHALLRVVRHLANGIKHFGRPRTDAAVVTTGIQEEGFVGFAPGIFEGWGGGEPFVELTPAEATLLGKPARLSARELAALVLAFWENHVDLPDATAADPMTTGDCDR